MALKDIREGRLEHALIKVDAIEAIPGWNVRQETEDLQEHIRGLAASIREIGLQEPISVFYADNDHGKTKAYIIDGHNRFKAICLVNEEDRQNGQEITVKGVPCFIKNKLSEAERTLQMLVMNSGKPLEPLEIALVFDRLHNNFGWSIEEIAKKGNVSIGDVYNKLALANAPQELIDLIKKGVVSPTLVQSVIREKGEDAATDLIVSAAKTILEGNNDENGNGNGKKKKKITKKDLDALDNDSDDDKDSNNKKERKKTPYKDAWQISRQIVEEGKVLFDEEEEDEITIRIPKVLWEELKPFVTGEYSPNKD